MLRAIGADGNPEHKKDMHDLKNRIMTLEEEVEYFETRFAEKVTDNIGGAL